MIKEIIRNLEKAEILEWEINWENKIFRTSRDFKKIKLVLFHDVVYEFFTKKDNQTIELEDAPETYFNWDQEKIKIFYEY